MKKKTIILSLTGALLICIAVVYLFFKQQAVQENVSMKTLRAVPLDALFFCYMDRLDILNETMTNDGSNWKAFADTSSPMLLLLQHMEKVATKNKTATEILRSEMIISAHTQGKEEITYLWVVAHPATVSSDDWFNFLKTAPLPMQTMSYQNHTIYVMESGNDKLYCASLKGLSLYSCSLLILQAAIRQVESETSIAEEEQFVTVLSTVGTNVDVRFFLNHRTIQKIWPLLVNEEQKKHGTFLSHTANWTALDGQVKPNMLHLSGFVFPSFTDDNYLSLMLSQQGANITAWDFLPTNTSIMLSFGFKDISHFFTAYHHYLEAQKKLPDYQRKLEAMEKQWQCKVEDFLAALYPEELMEAHISGIGWIMGLRSGNTKYALEQFREIAEKTGRRDFKTTKEIYRNPVEDMLSEIFGDAYLASGDRYFMIVKDWIIFSDNLQSLQRFPTQQTNLKAKMQEMQATQYINSNASFMICMQSSKNNDAFLSLLEPQIRKVAEIGLNNNPSGMTCLQLRSVQDKIYANLYAYFSEETRVANESVSTTTNMLKPTVKDTEPNTSQSVSQTATDKPTDSRLIHRFEVKNHYTKEKESLVQYADHAIALLSSKGDVLWNKKLDTAIIDTLIQIDFFKNGKLQMLFTTGNQLHLLDRNGNTVAPFPLNMQPEVISGVAVFDYAKDLEYRIFLAHADNTIRAYDKKGRVVAGFKTFKTKSQPVRAPEFVRAGGRDYILVFDQQEIYILNRQGNIRTEVQTAIAVAPHTAIEIQQSPAAIRVTTTKGTKVEIGLRDGKVK